MLDCHILQWPRIIKSNTHTFFFVLFFVLNEEVRRDYNLSFKRDLATIMFLMATVGSSAHMEGDRKVSGAILPIKVQE